MTETQYQPGTVCEGCGGMVSRDEWRTSRLFWSKVLCRSCMGREMERDRLAAAHRTAAAREDPDDPGMPMVKRPDLRPPVHSGPQPRTIEEARAILDGLGRDFRRLPERYAHRIFEIYRSARLA